MKGGEEVNIPFLGFMDNVPVVAEVPPSENPRVSNAALSEIGAPGLTRFGNLVQEDFLTLLRWPRAGKVYREMSYNDPVVGAILFTAEMLIRKASWRVEPASDSSVDKASAQFLTECMDDMSMPWIDMIAEILSMLSYGWAFHETVYKIRGGDVRDPRRHSKYSDNRIGWRRIAGRSQLSLNGWQFDEQGDQEATAMIQQIKGEAQYRVIPFEKGLLFRTKIESNNPEGRSVLRNAYRPWYFKKQIEEIEGIGIERDLAGLPVLTVPDGVDIWGSNDERSTQIRNTAQNIVRNIRRDQNEGIVLPFGWDLKLLSSGGSRQFDTSGIINRYDQRIAITLLSDIVMLGADKVGSFALANVKKSLLSTALDAILDSIAEIFNRHAVPRLFRYNSFPGRVDYPKLVHSSVQTPDLKELGEFIQKIAGAKMPLFPDEDMENYLRVAAGLPKRTEKSPTSAPVDTTPPNDGNKGSDGNLDGEKGGVNNAET